MTTQSTREFLEKGFRTQSKRVSAIEAVVNTVVGLLLASFCTWLICIAYDIPMTMHQNFVMVGWMTVVSVIRGYVLRRLFNSEFWRHWKWGKPKPKGPIQERPANLMPEAVDVPWPFGDRDRD